MFYADISPGKVEYLIAGTIARYMLNSKFLLQEFAHSVIYRPLVNVFDIPQSTHTSQNQNRDCISYAVKIASVFLHRFYFCEDSVMPVFFIPHIKTFLEHFEN